VSGKAQRTLTSVFRDADWLDGPRATAYLRILAAAMVVAVVAWIALSHGGIDRTGKPLGTDFLSFWAASKLALAGHAGQAYDPAVHAAVQRAAFPGTDVGYAAFFYPPVFLLICLPLAALPYLASLAAWLAVTGLACWQVLRGWLKQSTSMLAALAFPATFSNLGHGQNAFLTTALFGGGGLLLAARPFLAGLCFGALIFKPHLGLLIPVALLAGRQWKAIAGAVVSAAALIGLSLLAFGVPAWTGFLADSPLARAALEQELVGSAKMQSVFAAVRLWHGPLAVAYAAQALVALGVAAAVAVVFHRRRNDQGAMAALMAATLLASPFLLDYDLMLMAPPLAWLFAQGARDGFRPWEKLGLLAAFLLPLVSRILATDLHLPIAPAVLAVLFLLIWRRLAEDAPQRAMRRWASAAQDAEPIGPSSS
jgi:alpha-1,2-mannosyltransferase